MGNSNDKEEFNNLIKQLEYLHYKNNHIFKRNDEYYKIYGPMDINALIYNIKISIKNCEKKLMKILNSSNYSQGSLFKDKEIDNIIHKLINWKEKNPKDKYYFENAKQLLNKIQEKDLEISQPKMDIETNDERNTLFNVGSQNLLVNKQSVIQAQDLALLNDNFGRALASLECYANRYSGKNLSKIFDYYNMFNLGNTQNLKELEKKALIQIQIFKLAYEDYVNKYNFYNVPENINIGEIISLIKQWKNYISKDKEFMYQGMINIISSLNNNAFEQNYKSYSEQCKDAKMDPKKIASFAPGVYYYNKQRCDEAKNEFLEQGKIISKLIINESYKNDKKAEELEQHISINNHNYKEQEEYKDVK